MLTITANPGFALIVGALIAFAVPRAIRGGVMAAAGAAAIALMFAPPFGDYGAFAQIGLTVTLLRLDALSQTVGLACAIGGVLMAIATEDRRDRREDAAILLMAGGATTAVFAGDLISFIAAIELSSLAGAWILFAVGGRETLAAGARYLIWQGLGGLLLLAGVAFHLADGFGSAFTRLPADSYGGAFFLAGIAIKAGAPLAHVWLKDALSHASPTGAAALSMFAAKAALYGLARGFSGESMLVPAGAAMALLGVLYALAEDDLRRALAYSLIAQIGLVVAAIGVGAPLSLAGAAAHIFAITLSYGCLFLVLGAVMERTGATRASELGGLAQAMPLTAFFAVVAGLSAAGAPGAAGYVSETLALEAIARAGWREAWLILTAASAVTAAFAAVRLPAAIFLGPRRTEAHEAAPPFAMLLAMALAVFVTLAVGFAPGWLLGLLPPAPVAFNAYALDRLAPRLELVSAAAFAYSALHFLGLAPGARRRRLLDVDAIYRGPLAGAARWTGVVAMRLYGGFKEGADRLAENVGRGLAAFARTWDRPYAAGGMTALAGALGILVVLYVFAS